MKVAQEVLNVEKSGQFEENLFTIKANSKAFDILSSKLYSDKHLAIVRELSTNAWDAHVEAGTDRTPFEVHLPNKMEPFFFVRDFGTGMSHADVMHLYTTYFESTKTSTNKEVGCLGLGSKSPFSYTDNFSVVSWYQGKKRVYSMFKSDKGFPSVALLSTLDSDEPTGLEVRFACKTEDINIFLEKARFIYKKFPVKPKLLGNSMFTIEDRSISFVGKGWKAYKGRGSCYAVMGCIGYPIKNYFLNGNAYNLAYNSQIDIDFPIGSLEIAASREELQYSDLTKKVLTERLEAITSEIAENISQEFDNCKTLWEARCLWLDLFHHGGSFSYLSDSVGRIVSWKGSQIGRTTNICIQTLANCIEYRLTTNKNHDKIVRRRNDIGYISPARNIQFIMNDTDQDCGEKIRSWLKNSQTDIKKVYLIELPDLTKNTEEAFHNALGTTPRLFKLVSSLPKPIRKRTTGGGPRSRVPIAARGFTFDDVRTRYYDRYEKDAWLDATIDLTKPGIYVPWRRSKGFINNREISPAIINKILNCLKAIGKKPSVLYGIKSGYVEKALKVEPKWKDLLIYATESLEDYIKTNNLMPAIKGRKGSDKIHGFKKLEVISQYVNPKSQLKKFVDLVQVSKKERLDVENIIDLASLLGYPLKAENLEAEKEKINCRYPMINFVDWPYYGTHDRYTKRAKIVAEYVDMVDKLKG